MAVAGACAEAAKTVRVVPQSDLKILDPVWTTAGVTRNHGFMVYDTLFGLDDKGVIRPQMVDKYTTSPDGRVWTFVLRNGLMFHDGKPVTSEDVIASLKRWGQRDIMGQKMLAALDRAEAIDPNSFRFTFREPFGMVLDALSKPASIPPFIMPARIAATSPDKQIDDPTGSGPYIFKMDEFRPGERAVYLKNTKYVPRAEAPSGTAGGKRVYVDRMEWVFLKDAQTQANALAAGEVDLVEWAPSEQYLALKQNPSITVEPIIPKGTFTLHLNHFIPPFDNPKVAQAAIMALNQEAMMRAQQVHKELYSTCTSLYPCGSEYASTRTSYFTGKPQFERAKALLKEAGYNGKPVVLMYPADYAVVNKFPPVMAQLLKQAGFNVDMQSMDWPTLVARRAKKDPVDKGGWNLFITGFGNADTMNPIYFSALTGNGDGGWFGWATDEKLEKLKSEFVAQADLKKRKELAAEIQERVYDVGIVAPIGEYVTVAAYRKGVISGVVHAPTPVFWNIKKD
jgi:peptide/nickel transport system substrate-binding protein